jgi:hypothetical protein
MVISPYNINSFKKEDRKEAGDKRGIKNGVFNIGWFRNNLIYLGSYFIFV